MSYQLILRLMEQKVEGEGAKKFVPKRQTRNYGGKEFSLDIMNILGQDAHTAILKYFHLCLYLPRSIQKNIIVFGMKL